MSVLNARKSIAAKARFGVTASMLLAMAGLQACTVGPDYVRPEIVTPTVWSGELASGLEATPTDLGAWWSRLGDATLNGLIQRAVASNLDLRQAQARVRESRAALGVARSDELPSVDANGSYTRQRNSETTRQGGFSGRDTGEGYDLYSTGFDAGWEIDIFGRVRRNVEAASADLDSAVEARRDVLVTLVAEVARNYVELRALQRRLDIAQQNLRSQEDTLTLVRSRFEAGLTNELDVARARTNVETTRSQIPTLVAGARRTIFRLSVLLGSAPGALAQELETPGAIPSVSGAIPVGVPGDVIRRRADVRRAERSLAAATARIGVATADLYPRFRISGNLGFQSGQFGQFFNGDSFAWGIGPSFTWAVFEAGRIRGTIAAQDARTEAAMIAYEASVLRAMEEVEGAMVSFAQEHNRRASLVVAAEAAQRAVTLSQELYSRGLTDFQNVLDAQRNLFSLQDDVVQSERTLGTEFIAMYKALGGGWETFEPTTDQPTSADGNGAPPATAPKPGNTATPAGATAATASGASSPASDRGASSQRTVFPPASALVP